jgi:uncharacterized protein YjiK
VRWIWVLAATLVVACDASGAGKAKKKGGGGGAGSALGEGVAVLKAGVAEPSGITFDAARGHFFVVGDEGTLAELDAQGGFVRSSPVAGNLEDVAVHPPSGALVILDEAGERLIVYDPGQRRERARFKLDSEALVGKRVGSRNGFEGLCFRAQAGKPGGGVFYLAHQSGPAMVVAIAFDPAPPGGTIGAEAVISRFSLPGQSDLNAVVWAPSLQRLLVLSDSADALLVVNEGGAVEGQVHVPGLQQEGACLDAAGDLWIADDRGGSVKRYGGALQAIADAEGGAAGGSAEKKKGKKG